MKKLLIFAGTTEGREISLAAAGLGYDVTTSVATEYGKAQFTEIPTNLTILTGRMETDKMADCMKQGGFNSVIDATHPYAVAVSANIKAACESAQIPYLRLLREASHAEGCTYFGSLQEACQAANLLEGNILATTGSKDLVPYTAMQAYKSRVFVRVLPTKESVFLCQNAGFLSNHIIAAKGPFSKEENLKTLRQHSIQTLITKDGGVQGGFDDKISAARAYGANIFVIRRPREHGRSYQQVISILKEEL